MTCVLTLLGRPTLQLGLNISPPGVRSIGDALEEFTHAEIIPDYRVRRCLPTTH